MKPDARLRPLPTKTPAPLAPGHLIRAVERSPLLLCLDYDGTLSEITADVGAAGPLTGVRAALEALSRLPGRVVAAVISGRDIATLRRLLGIDRGLMMVGTHGLEFSGTDGTVLTAEGAAAALPDLERVRNFVRAAVNGQSGFLVEDKRLALALHYRLAEREAARVLLDRIRRFVASKAPHLRMLEGKMVLEMLPNLECNKGSAVLWLVEHAGLANPHVAYIGDDTTDEDAFFALRGRDATTVLVGPAHPSFAAFRVEGPAEVAAVLIELADALTARASG